MGAVASLGASVAAQQQLVDRKTASSGIIFESWNFGNVKPGSGSSMVSSATQFTIPLTSVIPLREGWALDTYVAYASGSVEVDRGGTTGKQTLALSGVNDVKLRLVGKLSGDNVLLTLGGTVPSGATGLDQQQLEALSVLAAPSLRFRTPGLGAGAGATTGLIVAGQSGGWALAAAGAFELRGNYAPAASFTAGLPKPALKAGNALHLSLGADRAMESTRETIGLNVDYFTSGTLNDPEASVSQTNFQLGPSVTGTYQVDITTGDVESVLYLLQRFRSQYKLEGAEVPGSWRSETELGTMTLVPLSPEWTFRLGVDGRLHSANRAALDDRTLGSFALAGMLAGGLTLGVHYGTPAGGLGFEPFVRGQMGRLDLGGPTRPASEFSAGVTLISKF
jgi:hypothetical protein